MIETYLYSSAVNKLCSILSQAGLLKEKEGYSKGRSIYV